MGWVDWLLGLFFGAGPQKSFVSGVLNVRPFSILIKKEQVFVGAFEATERTKSRGPEMI